MVQQLKVLPAFPEDLSSVPSSPTPDGTQLPITPASGDPSDGLHGTRTCDIYSHGCIYKIKIQPGGGGASLQFLS